MAEIHATITTNKIAKSFTGSEVTIFDFEKTPTRQIIACNLADLVKQVQAFAQELEGASCGALKTSVRLAAGQRSPNGFMTLSTQRNSPLHVRINADQAKALA